jgi:hypothetical protein
VEAVRGDDLSSVELRVQGLDHDAAQPADEDPLGDALLRPGGEGRQAKEAGVRDPGDGSVDLVLLGRDPLEVAGMHPAPTAVLLVRGREDGDGERSRQLPSEAVVARRVVREGELQHGACP